MIKKKLFDIRIDQNIDSIIPKKWDYIYKKNKNNNFNENEIIEIGDNIFQLTVIVTKILDNSIIKLLFTNISEIANTNIQIENSFKLLYEQMPYPYQSLNHLGQITNVNNKWLELTGYSKDEVINQKFSKFTDETHETLKGLFSIFLKK